MESINEDIKSGCLKQMYLLYGEEAYLRKQYRDKLKNVLADSSDTMNYSYFEGKTISPGAVIDLAETLPFFARHRLILIENSGWFKKGGEQMADYLAAPAATCFFIFAETEVDKRSRIFKLLSTTGRAVEFPIQKEPTLKKWILGILKKEGKQITGNALDLFLEKTGTDMENIRMELEKLLCYCIDREAVEEQDIEAICTSRISNQIFQMINAVAEKKQREALNLYYDLLTLREPAMRILFLVARQFNLLLQVKELKEKGYENKEIGSKTGLAPFIAAKYVTQAARFQKGYLRQALEDCVEAEEAVKTGKINDVMSVELLIVRYSS